MTEMDLLKNLMNTNPNEPATQGIVLLHRAETQSEFRIMRQKFEQVDRRFDQMDQRFDRMDQRLSSIENSLELLAQQMAILVSRA